MMPLISPCRFVTNPQYFEPLTAGQQRSNYVKNWGLDWPCLQQSPGRQYQANATIITHHHHTPNTSTRDMVLTVLLLTVELRATHPLLSSPETCLLTCHSPGWSLLVISSCDDEGGHSGPSHTPPVLSRPQGQKHQTSSLITSSGQNTQFSNVKLHQLSTLHYCTNRSFSCE